MNDIYTIGHSTRDIEDFIGLLKSVGVNQLVDIRTIPRSRHNPQFAQEQLKSSLERAGIKYVYMKDLGGLRPAVKNSTNQAWRNKSFRNYADYMQSEEFKRALGELMDISSNRTTAIMCAEAVPWRCHRSLVADALVVRDVKVWEIISDTDPRPHKLTPFAVVDGEEVSYPKVD